MMARRSATARPYSPRTVLTCGIARLGEPFGPPAQPKPRKNQRARPAAAAPCTAHSTSTATQTLTTITPMPTPASTRRLPPDERYDLPAPKPKQRAPRKPPKQPPLARPQQHMVDPAALQICNDPLPDDHWSVATPGKYDAKFALLKPGQALRCASGETQAVARALRKYLAVRKLKHLAVRTMRDYGDGYGRVWLMPAGKGGARE